MEVKKNRTQQYNNLVPNRIKCCPTKMSSMRCFMVFFYLILYVPSTIFQLCRDGSSWVEPVCVSLKDHNAVTPVRLEPAAPRSRVKHSTTEPLRSLSLTGPCMIFVTVLM